MSIFRTITTLLLAALLAVATTGISVVYHYCAGELDGISLFADGKTCDCDGETPRSCCKDEVALYKLDTDCKLTTPVPPVQLLPVAVLPLAGTLVSTAHSIALSATPPVDTSPPRATDIPVLICSLLI